MLKIIDFHRTVVIFEVFAVSTCDVNFVVFYGLLGSLGELLGPPLGILGGFLGDEARNMPPRQPKEPPQGTNGCPNASKRPTKRLH